MSIVGLADARGVTVAADGGGVNPARVYLSRLGPGTRRSAVDSLRVIAGILSPGMEWDRVPWQLLRAEHVTAIRSELAANYRHSTANRHLGNLRGVLKTCWRLGLLDAEALARALDIPRVKGSSLPAGRDIPPAEIAALFATCDGSTVGRRDRALLAVLRLGLRRSEVVGLDLADVDQAAGVLHVRKGKGGKDRDIPLSSAIAAALNDWIAPRGDSPGALFLSTSGDNKGRPAGSRLSGQVIYELVKRRCRQAGIASPVVLHDWRRTFAGDLFDLGVDAAAIAALMGHASISTTGRYDRRPTEARRAAIEGLFVPSGGDGAKHNN